MMYAVLHCTFEAQSVPMYMYVIIGRFSKQNEYRNIEWNNHMIIYFEKSVFFRTTTVIIIIILQQSNNTSNTVSVLLMHIVT